LGSSVDRPPSGRPAMHRAQRRWPARRLIGSWRSSFWSALVCVLAPAAIRCVSSSFAEGCFASWTLAAHRLQTPRKFVSQARQRRAHRQVFAHVDHDKRSSGHEDFVPFVESAGRPTVALFFLALVVSVCLGANAQVAAILGCLMATLGMLRFGTSTPDQAAAEEVASAEHLEAFAVHGHERICSPVGGSHDGSHSEMHNAKHTAAIPVALDTKLVGTHGNIDLSMLPGANHGDHSVHEDHANWSSWERTRDAVAAGITTALFGVAESTTSTKEARYASPGIAVSPPFEQEEPTATSAATEEPQAAAGQAVEEFAAVPGVVAKHLAADLSETPGSEPEVVVPGMAEANLVVSVECDKQMKQPASQREGVQLLMLQPGGKILASMAQDGWKVEAVDPATGIYELSLPAVEYNLGMGIVSIPSPLFRANISDTRRKDEDGDMERLAGDLVLQNGEGILTVKLGFPFSTTLSVSAAGLARARIGQSEDAVYLQADVEIGLRIPRVPGLEKIMQLFVKSYANKSTFDCSTALSKGADKIAAETKAEVMAKSAVAAATAAAAAATAEVDIAGMAVEAGQFVAQTANDVMLQSGMEDVPEMLESLM